MSEERSDIAWTPTPTATLDHRVVRLERKSIMEMLEAVKTILEIIVIFITFPQYAPLLGAIAALGAVYYYLLQEGDNNNEAKELGTSIPEVTEESPDSKQLRPSRTSSEAEQ